LAVESDHPIAQPARDLGINENTLHTWISKHHQRTHGTPGQLDATHFSEELKRLKKANALLQEEREIFKKAAAFFAAHSR
jgi:transposase